MLFNSLDFLFFFPIVVLIYFAIPDRIKYLWLLVCSYYFYMCWNAKYALLILFSTTITYLSGILLEKAKSHKKLIVTCSLLLNLGVLFYYKYINFTLDTLGSIFSFVGIQLNIPQFDILLPVGISFYTFQALSYTIDVYRGDIYAEKNFFRYALFVSFFPQLVAGPIERSKNLLKQLAVPKKFDFKMAEEGFLLMLWGFFLKIVLADRIAIFVDTVYGNYNFYHGWFLIVATMLFAVQIYCDFYGYSVIAIGAARILGIQLMENFDAPYLSNTVAEFWRKWHISLTSWFKDYLYIPLGGSRKGKYRKYINKIIVFFASGIWHGASLSFVAWGVINGFYQVIGEITEPLRKKWKDETIGYKFISGLTTFCLIDFSWIFFRANTLQDSFSIIKNIVSACNPWILFDGSLYLCGLDAKNFGLMLLCIFILLFADICKHKGIKIYPIITGQNYLVKSIFISLSILFILVFGKYGPSYDAANFIYFQF